MSPKAKAKAKQDEAVTIEVPKLDIGRATITIEGNSPGLLCARKGKYAHKNLDELRKNTTIPAKKRPPETAEVIADKVDDALYKLSPARGGSEFGFPANAIKKAMVVSGYRFGNSNMTDLRGAFFIEADSDGLIPISGVDWVHDTRIGMPRGAKGGVICDRPLFPGGWEMAVDITFNKKVITLQKVADLLELAGYSTGIGAYRPETNGPFGRFHIKVK